MTWTRVAALVLVLAVEAGCTGGGGSSSSAPSATWEKFRHDLGNTGEGVAGVVKNAGGTPTPVAILWSTNLDGSPISASPAVGLNNTVFIGSEGGTLAALDSSDGTSTWPTFVDSCAACACQPGASGLGVLSSSPAVYTNNSQTNVFLGSTTGAVFGFQFTNNDLPTCVFCFQPTCTDNTLTAASFVSSPTFTINPATLNVAGIFIGATVTDAAGGKRGRLYALNADGTIKWQYPKHTAAAIPTPTPGVGTPTPAAGNAGDIGPITSSPAIGFGSSVYFTTDDGFLYALTSSGDFLWKAELSGSSDLPLAPSPVANTTSIITSSADGVILALNANGTFQWGLDAPSSDPNDGFANSLAVGAPGETPTPTPGTGTATPAPLTPTLTPVPGTTLITVIAVRRSGTISLIDAATGRPLPPHPLAQIAGPVLSSPALSSDGYIVIGDHDGVLHCINTVDGMEPVLWNWPITLVPNAQATPRPIRSSPALDGNGVAYVGSDDGHVYAVGTQ